MGVVSFVAAVAVCFQRNFKAIAGVAIVTSDTEVSAGQCKTCSVEMVEEVVGPVRGLVAVLAVIAIAAHVGVVFTVTAIALRRSVDIDLVDMAADAGEIGMRPGQCIAALDLMIVERITPLSFTMAIRTLCAEVAQVLIVFDMTVVTLGAKDIVERFLWCVAVLTDRLEVTVAQWKVCQCVIESVLVEADDVGIAADVIGMAGCAGRLRVDFRRERVKSRVRRQVFGDFYMTLQAKLGLTPARKSRMTVFALGLILRMTGYDRPGHDDSFECFELCCRVHAHQRHQ